MNKKHLLENCVRRSKLAVLLAASLACVSPTNRLSAAELDKPSAVGSALGSMFNPALAPDVKTMGLAQRVNFVDMVKEIRGNLELVIVVDATESMEEQLNGVRSMLGTMLNDLGRTLTGHVKFQIVMFRDFGANSQGITWPLGESRRGFVSDIGEIQKSLEQLVPGSGRPYFHEPVDLAIYSALTEIPWSQDPQDGHWILYIGDAPPLKIGFNEPQNHAVRSHSDQQLVALANEKNVSIHAIVCPTREIDRKIYEAVINDLLSFCSNLTTETGGMMLDMSDPNVLADIRSAAQTQIITYTKVERISQTEVDDYKSKALTKAAADLKKNRVAVLPHLPLEKMDFSRRNPAVLVADEMRAQLDDAGMNTVYMHQLERAFFSAQSKGKTRDEVLQQVALAVNADTVMWGDYLVGSPNTLTPGIFDAATNQYRLVSKVQAKDPNYATLCSAALSAVAKDSKARNQSITFAAFTPEKFKTRLVASKPEVERLMGSARLALEQAIELLVTEPLAAELYGDAEKDLLDALRIDSNNPVLNGMLANTYFGKYQIARQNGNADSDTLLRSANRIATEAYRYRNQAAAADAMEIEGDFRFYQGRFADCIAAYEKLAASQNNEQARRARYQLIGLYSGDWGVHQEAKELVNPTKAHEHAVAIMALWPDSHEANYMKKVLGWDEKSGRTMSPHVPVTEQSIPVTDTAKK